MSGKGTVSKRGRKIAVKVVQEEKDEEQPVVLDEVGSESETQEVVKINQESGTSSP